MLSKDFVVLISSLMAVPVAWNYLNEWLQQYNYRTTISVVTGRDALQKGAESWFKNATVEFVENIVESTVFNGGTAIQTCIFSIKNTPKNGGKPEISRGRSMVIYVRDKDSPSGWLSLREMAQAAPEKK